MISEHGAEHPKPHLPHISRRAFLATLGGGLLATVTGALAIDRFARSTPAAAPGLASGPGPEESGQDTTGLRSVPAEIKTAAARPHPAVDTAERALNAIFNGDPEGFDQEVSPNKRYTPDKRISLRILETDVQAFQSCKSVKYNLNDGGYTDSNTHEIAILFEKPCIQYPGYPATNRAIFTIEPINDGWYITKFSS